MTPSKTRGDLYGPAMRVTDQAEADACFETILEYIVAQDPTLSREHHERIQRANLAYYAGYYNDEIRARVERLFRCAHPVFGAIEEKGPPTSVQAASAGTCAAKGQS